MLAVSLAKPGGGPGMNGLSWEISHDGIAFPFVNDGRDWKRCSRLFYKSQDCCSSLTEHRRKVVLCHAKTEFAAGTVLEEINIVGKALANELRMAIRSNQLREFLAQ